MLHSSPTFFVFTVVTLATSLCGFVGCTNGPLKNTDWSNPFQTVDTSYKESYGPTPSDVANQIRELGANVANMSAAEQEETALKLTQRYESEDDPLLRRQMIFALGSFPDPYATRGLRAAMSDADPFVRIEACRAWGRRASQEAMQMLANAIEMDQSVDVRQAAIQGIKRYQHPDAVRALGGVLSERDPALQLLAMQSLKGASGKDLGNDVRKWDEYIAANYPSSAGNTIGIAESESTIAESSDVDIWR